MSRCFILYGVLRRFPKDTVYFHNNGITVKNWIVDDSVDVLQMGQQAHKVRLMYPHLHAGQLTGVLQFLAERVLIL
jgi:hypothetical protein